MSQSKQFLKSNLEVIEKWAAFADVCQQNGETPQGVRARLAANNLTQEQIDMLMNKDSEAFYRKRVRVKNVQRCMLAIPLLVAAPFLMVFEVVLLPYRLPIAGIMCLGFGLKVLAKYKRV
ncbi:MAG: hypothetical protein M3R17_14105 [Bacteroidota bacterium]|nr:hypothetical protein [Bacteroidota bacterium]